MASLTAAVAEGGSVPVWEQRQTSNRRRESVAEVLAQQLEVSRGDVVRADVREGLVLVARATMHAFLPQCLGVALRGREQPPDLAPRLIEADVARECERDLDPSCHPPCAHDDHGCRPWALVLVHVADVLLGGMHPQCLDASEAHEAEAILEPTGADSLLARACVHLDRVLDQVAGCLAERTQVLLACPRTRPIRLRRVWISEGL